MDSLTCKVHDSAEASRLERTSAGHDDIALSWANSEAPQFISEAVAGHSEEPGGARSKETFGTERVLQLRCRSLELQQNLILLRPPAQRDLLRAMQQAPAREWAPRCAGDYAA